MAEQAALENALRAADKAGNVEDARKLAAALASMRSNQSVIGDVKATGDKISDAIKAPPDSMKGMTHDISKSTGQIEDKFASDVYNIDRSGLPAKYASRIMQADNPKEKLLHLQSFDPKATFGKDTLGREYVTLGTGKKVYVEPIGQGVMGKLGAEAETIGEEVRARPVSTGGAIVGGMIGGVPGAALMAGAGHLAEQGAKALKGRYSQTPGELAFNTAESGAMAGVSEGISRVPGALIRGGLPRWLTGTTDETAEFGSKLAKAGATPAYKSSAPGLASVEWKVNLAKKLGLPENNKKLQAVASELENFLKKKGIEDTEGTLKPTAGVTPRVGGEEKYWQTLADPVIQMNKQIDAAKEAATKSLQSLRVGRGPTSPNFKEDVKGYISNARTALSHVSDMEYQKLAAIEGDMAVSMHPVAEQADRILASLPKTDKGDIMIPNEKAAPKIAFLKQLSQTKGDMPIAMAAKMRTDLNALGGFSDLTQSAKSHLEGTLRDTLDQQIKTASSANPKAAAERGRIEKWYAGEINKFNDNVAARLVKQAGETGSVDADEVIPLMSTSSGQFRRVWNLLEDPAKRRVGRGLFDQMIDKSSKNGEISGQAFYDQLSKNAPLLREVYGKDAPKMIQSARALAALDGKMPLNTRLLPETVVKALETANKTQGEMDKFYSKNALAALPGADSGSEAFQTALQAAKKTVSERMAPYIEDKVPTTPEMRAKIEAAGNKVGTTPDKKIDLSRQRTIKTLEDFDAGRFAKLADPKFLKDGAVNYIVRPGQLDLLKKAVTLYGPGSEQVKTLQEAFLRKAVASGTRDVTDPQRAFGGQGIRDFLKSYTPEQKKLLLEPYGGEGDLQKISRFYDFAFPVSNADVSAGLAGGELKSKIGPGALLSAKGLGSIAKYGKSYLTGYLLSNPQVYKWLVLGMDGNPAALQALDAGMRTYVQSHAQNMQP